MNATELKQKHEENHILSKFFSRETMKFFGDTMRNFGVRRQTVMIQDCLGAKYECYELYRKRPVKEGVQSSYYFDVITFRRINKPL